MIDHEQEQNSLHFFVFLPFRSAQICRVALKFWLWVSPIVQFFSNFRFKNVFFYLRGMLYLYCIVYTPYRYLVTIEVGFCSYLLHTGIRIRFWCGFVPGCKSYCGSGSGSGSTGSFVSIRTVKLGFLVPDTRISETLQSVYNQLNEWRRKIREIVK